MIEIGAPPPKHGAKHITPLNTHGAGDKGNPYFFEKYVTVCIANVTKHFHKYNY
jgi:hypothetical protein